MKYVIWTMLFLLLGCASQSHVKKQVEPSVKNLIPTWYRQPPHIKNALVVVASAKSTHLETAMKKALQNLYAENGRSISAYLDGMVDYKKSEINDQIRERLEQVSVLTSVLSLGNVVIMRQAIKKESYYFYVYLMSYLPVSVINEKLRKQQVESLFRIQSGDDKIVLSQSPLVDKPVNHMTQYPEWFLTPTILGDYASTGVSPKAYYRENAIKAAIKDAALRKAKFRSVHIFGHVENILSGHWDYLAQNQVQMEYDTTGISAWMSKEPEKVQFKGNLCLVETGGKQVQQKFTDGKWRFRLPSDKYHYYAVGVAPLYFHEENSWVEADNDALVKLALMAMAGIQSQIEKTTTLYKETNRIELDVHLKNVQLLARFRDENLVFVLVKMPRN